MEFIVCKVALDRSLFNVNRRGNVRMNVTLRRVRISIVAVDKQEALHILSVYICIFSYPACNAHEPYCIVTCGLSGCAINFPRYLINCTIFGGKNNFEHKMCVLVFFTTFV